MTKFIPLTYIKHTTPVAWDNKDKLEKDFITDTIKHGAMWNSAAITNRSLWSVGS